MKKGSDNFKVTIQSYLENLVNTDDLFKAKFENKNKNIDDCIDYIITTVKNSGANGFTSSEIYSMAVHYYEEENIELEKGISANVIVDHKIELTDEEIKEARQAAIRNAELDARLKLENKKKTKKIVETEVPEQQSLF